MIQARSLAPNRPPLAYLFVPFTDLERGVLERFVRKVEALQDSEFPLADLNIIATPYAGPGPCGGQGWSFRLDGPDEREVKAVIGDFRQIYTDHNRTSASSVLKMLKEHAYKRGTDSSRRMIRELKSFGKQLGKRKKRDPRGKLLEGSLSGDSWSRSPDSIVKDWFNGVYFHDDPGPASELEDAGSTTVEMFRWSLQNSIKDFIIHWGKLRILVDAVLRDPALRS